MGSLAAVLFVLAAVAGAASAGPVDPADDIDVPAGTSATQIGRFALLMYNLNRNAQLKYVGVSDSSRRPHRGGFRFTMVVTAADAAGATRRYRAVVWGIPKTYQWMLLEFKHIVN